MRQIPRLVTGIEHWLNFEFHCFRGKLFSESYLKAGVGQLMSASGFLGTPGISIAEYPLAPTNQRGRPKAIDFVFESFDINPQAGGREVLYAVETKWAASTHATILNLFKDAIRLKIFKSLNQQCDCILLLAGPKDDIRAIFSSALLRAVLSVRNSHQRDIGLSRPNQIVAGLLGEIDDSVLLANLPEKIVSSVTKGEHFTSEQGSFHAVGWKIR